MHPSVIVTEFFEVSIEYVKALLAPKRPIPSTRVSSEFVRTKSVGKRISMIHPVFRGSAESNSSLKSDFS